MYIYIYIYMQTSVISECNLSISEERKSLIYARTDRV